MLLRSGWRVVNANNVVTSSTSRSRSFHSSTAAIMRGITRHPGWNIRACRSIRRSSTLLGTSTSPTCSTITSTWMPTRFNSQSVSILATCSFAIMNNSMTLTTTRTIRTSRMWQMGLQEARQEAEPEEECDVAVSLRRMAKSSTR